MTEEEQVPQDLQISIAELESLKDKASFQIEPLIALYKTYQKQPDLAMPIILAGIKNISEEGELMTSATPDHCKAILAAQKPLSPGLTASTSRLVSKSAERLITKLRNGESLQGMDIIPSKELSSLDFATTSAEQPDVRRAYGAWAEYDIHPKHSKMGYGKPYKEFTITEVLKEVYPASK